MTTVTLRGWDEAGRCWILDVALGQVMAASNGLSHGFLYVSPRDVRASTFLKISAAYAGGLTLWFQADNRRWPIDEVDFSYWHDRSGLSHFIVKSCGISVVDISYFGPSSDPVYKKDPTLDELDVELLDFFYLLQEIPRIPLGALQF